MTDNTHQAGPHRHGMMSSMYSKLIRFLERPRPASYLRIPLMGVYWGLLSCIRSLATAANQGRNRKSRKFCRNVNKYVNLKG